MRRVPGGTCGNVAILLSRFSRASVTVAASVGDDLRGRVLERGLTAEGLSTRGLSTREGRMTGAVVEVLRPERRTGHRFLFSCPACRHNVKFSNLPSRLDLKAWSKQMSNFDVLFVDRATPALIELAAAARDAKVLVVFEPNRVTPGSLNERMALMSDIVKVAAPEGGLATLEGLKTRGALPRLLVQTSGEKGLTFALRLSDADWTPSRHLPPVRSEATIDTAGAGDWCTVGLLDGLLQRSGPRWETASVTESLRMGQALAAFSLQFVGPRGILDHCSSRQVRRAAEQALTAGFAAKMSKGVPPGPKWDEWSGGENHCAVCLSTLRSAKSSGSAAPQGSPGTWAVKR